MAFCSPRMALIRLDLPTLVWPISVMVTVRTGSSAGCAPSLTATPAVVAAVSCLSGWLDDRQHLAHRHSADGVLRAGMVKVGQLDGQFLGDAPVCLDLGELGRVHLDRGLGLLLDQLPGGLIALRPVRRRREIDGPQ